MIARPITPAEDERYRLENLHLYFRFLNSSHPIARKVAFWSYIVGFGFLAVPSGKVFVRVVWLFVKLII
jgi:hypothetical protein